MAERGSQICRSVCRKASDTDQKEAEDKPKAVPEKGEVAGGQGSGGLPVREHAIFGSHRVGARFQSTLPEAVSTACGPHIPWKNAECRQVPEAILQCC